MLNLTSQNGLNPRNEGIDEFAENVTQGMSLLEITPPLALQPQLLTLSRRILIAGSGCGPAEGMSSSLWTVKRDTVLKRKVLETTWKVRRELKGKPF